VRGVLIVFDCGLYPHPARYARRPLPASGER
jgi:hypothetical protein